jgi:hypothetical protein
MQRTSSRSTLAPPFRGGWEGSLLYKSKSAFLIRTPLIPLRGTFGRCKIGTCGTFNKLRTSPRSDLAPSLGGGWEGSENFYRIFNYIFFKSKSTLLLISSKTLIISFSISSLVNRITLYPICSKLKVLSSSCFFCFR